MNKILLITLSIFLIAFTSASIYCGDSGTLDFPNDKPVNITYELNNTIMDWFSWYKNGTTIYWKINEVCEDDNFEVTWYNGEYQQTFSSSGGSSSSKNKIKDNSDDSLNFIVRKVNTTEDDNEIETNETEDIEEIENKDWRKWLLIIPFLVLVVIIIFIIFKRNKLKKEDLK